MKKYLSRVKRFIKKFKEASFFQILTEENMEADALAKEALADALVKVALADGLLDDFDEVQYMPSIHLLEVQQIKGEEN